LACSALLVACSKLGTDLDDVVAIEIVIPDSMFVGDILTPQARALNGRGDSVAAEIFWSSLDTAVVAVLDSTTGETLGKKAGTGRLQARTGALRSNPQSILVRDVPTPSGPVSVHLSDVPPAGQI
jgi:hypothetical protein